MDKAEQDVTKARQLVSGEADACEAAYEAYFRGKVDEGLRELDQGNAIPHSETKKRLRHYLR